MTSIFDVAKKAGVSKTTVSRVLLGSDKVKPSTKEKVLQVIEEMNYSPNTAARTLASKRSMNIGVISCYTFNDPFYSIVSEEIYYACEKRGYSALFVVNRPDEAGHKDPIDILNGKVDGFIYLGEGSVSRRQLEKLIKMGIPAATFKTGIHVDGIIETDIDNVNAAYEGTNYLIGLGHRKIAVLAGNMNNYETKDRLEGYKKALKEHDIQFDSALIFCGGFSYDKGLELAKVIIDTKATAVFCFNDVMAHGFARGAKDAHFRIPEDISVLGYDDIIFRNYGPYIKLSTVKQPVREMGRYLAETMMAEIEGENGEFRKIFPAKISEKETTCSV